MTAPQVASQEWIERIESLVRQAEALPDPAAKQVARELLNAVLEFHSAGIEKLLEISMPLAGEPLLEAISKNELTSSMLLLHGLHPEDVETRIERAIDKLQHRFQPWGGNVRFVSFEGGVVRVRYESRKAASESVGDVIERALFDAAPDIQGVIVDGITGSQQDGFVPLASLVSPAGVA